jgi:hypothetical protein
MNPPTTTAPAAPAAPPAAPPPTSDDDDDYDESVWGDVEADDGIAEIQGRGDDDAADDDAAVEAKYELSRVIRAVEAGVTPAELRRVIAEVSRGCAERRLKAVNLKASGPSAGDWRKPTAYEVACGNRAWPLAGVLIAAGADFRLAFHGLLTRLGACAVCGDAEGVRELLRAGHDARETMPPSPPHHRMAQGQTAAHVALSFHLGCAASLREGQVGAVRALVRDGGADLEARDARGDSVLLKIAGWKAPDGIRPALRVLVGELGADVDATNAATGHTLLFALARRGFAPEVRALLDDHGADANVVDLLGMTPLMWVSEAQPHWQPSPYNLHVRSFYPNPARGMLLALLRASSTATRRTARTSDGATAADILMLESMRWAGAQGGNPDAVAADMPPLAAPGDRRARRVVGRVPSSPTCTTSRARSGRCRRCPRAGAGEGARRRRRWRRRRRRTRRGARLRGDAGRRAGPRAGGAAGGWRRERPLLRAMAGGAA